MISPSVSLSATTMMLYWIASVVILSTCYVTATDSDELKAVVVLFRHGDRAPLSSWPNDEYFGDSSLWLDGYGQLNNMGKERHYKLGQWFRERYDGFLPKRYNRSDIYVRSTDVDRTLMSASFNLAGLYPPEGDQVWNEGIPWQAIPIHTTPQTLDPVLTAEAPCPKYKKLFSEFKQSDEYEKLNKQHAELFKNISKLAGYDSVTVETFGGIFSTANIYREYNLTLPDWVDYYWPEIQTLAAISFKLDTYTEDMAKLRSGPFFDYLLTYFNSVQNQTQSPTKHIRGPHKNDVQIEDSPAPKFLMLSAHDTTIADRTNALGVFVEAVPEFASTVIWELRSNNGYMYVNMYHKNSTSFIPLKLPECDFDCSLNNYVKYAKPVTLTVDAWKKECNDD